MPSKPSRSPLNLLAAAFAVSALSGCVDQFTTSQPADARHYVGETSPVEPVGTVAPVTGGGVTPTACGPFRFDVAVDGDRIAGRVEPIDWRPGAEIYGWPGGITPTTGLDLVTSWWVEGTVANDATVQLETRMQAPYWHGARPYAVWRGARDGQAIVLTESAPSCGRMVTLRPD